MLKVKFETIEQDTNKKDITYLRAMLVDISQKRISLHSIPIGSDIKPYSYYFKRDSLSKNYLESETATVLSNLWIDGELIDLSYKEDKNV